MDSSIRREKLVSEHADNSGSGFHDVNLADATFEDVNLSRARFHGVNLSDVDISAAQIGGATFKHIGLPPGEDSHDQRQRPVTFEEMTLCDSTFRRVDLSNVEIVDCNIQGMTIDGVLVTDLLLAHQSTR